VPPIVWTAVSGPPGVAKTAGQRQAVRPLEQLEGEWADDWAARADLHRERWAGNKSAPPPPAQRRIHVQSSTIETLPRMMLANPGAGLLWEQSELSSIIGSLDQYHAGTKAQSPGRAEFLSLWDGRPLSKDRVGEGRTYVPSPRVSVTGAIVSDRLTAILGTSDGMGSRFMIAHRPDAGLSLPDFDADADWATVQRWDELVRSLVYLPTSGEPPSVRAPVIVRLSREAKAILNGHRETVGKQYQQAGGFGQEVVAKGYSQLGRLALIFHLADTPGTVRPELGAEATERAVAVLDYFFDSALSQAPPEVSAVADTNTRRVDDGVQRLVQWLWRREGQTATVREARRARAGGCRTTGELRRVIARYVESYPEWVVETPLDRDSGSPSTILWAPGVSARLPLKESEPGASGTSGTGGTTAYTQTPQLATNTYSVDLTSSSTPTGDYQTYVSGGGASGDSGASRGNGLGVIPSLLIDQAREQGVEG
jgi:hypothetical protein